MSGFLFGLVCGFVLGGFFVDVNLRCPDRLKSWFAGLFGSKSEEAAK